MRKKIFVLFLAFLLAFFPVGGIFALTGDGEPSSYGYNETPAESVTVTVTLSNDGIPIMGKGDVPLANLEVTVPYFDLKLYGLEGFYRCHTENGKGIYVDSTVVERPTVLHLYIYLLERYYLGLDEEDCGKGNSQVTNYSSNTDVYYFDDAVKEAYSSGTKKALYITGKATSMYMSNFWGHDENLMYYRNHRYPLMREGWGATGDYILLSDGDRIDLAMFSNWDFHTNGAFLSFDEEKYTAEIGTELAVAVKQTATSAGLTGEETPIVPYTGETNVELYDASWNKVMTEIVKGTNGEYTVTLPKTAGTYYIMASDVNGKTNSAAMAPATAKIVVESAVFYGDVNGDGKVNSDDAMLILQHYAQVKTLSSEFLSAADVNGDEKINSDDAMLVLQRYAQIINKFPIETIDSTGEKLK
ncbi:MAG: dockerin type I domain-containing protein [Oscillospiraceae bacterium]